MMGNLDRRLSRLEAELVTEIGPRIAVLTNVNLDHIKAPGIVKFAHDRWAIPIRGGPFTDDEIQRFKHERSNR